MHDQGVIYVVDDDPAVLDSLEALLSQYDYQVRCFSSAASFLEDAILNSAGCLITDVQMPEMNGAELLQKLNALKSTLSMVVVTGVADVPTAVALMQSGATTLLEKPYDQNELLDAVGRALVTSHSHWNQEQAKKSVRQRLETLSEDEESVMKLMLAGEPNKGISSKLTMSMRTVDRRRHSILSKMQVASVPELATLLSTSR
jgi:two-component system, LuxR family, response regulator FixJ